MPRTGFGKNRTSHINATLSAPGFRGFPSSDSPMFAYGEGETRPSPYGDLSLDIVTPPTIVQQNYNTGRRVKASQQAPIDTDDFKGNREVFPGIYPQAATSRQTGRASNFNTIDYPNPDPFPVMIGMLDAQITAMKQDEEAHKAYNASLGAAVNSADIKERLKSPAELYFEEFKKRGDTAELTRLQNAGFTDAEIAQYVSQQRMGRMAAAATRQEPNDDIAAVMARMAATAAGPATGFGAVGDVAMSAARVQNFTVPTPTPVMLQRNRASAMGTGGSVASLLLGAEDPRSALSVAAQRASAGDIFGSAVPGDIGSLLRGRRFSIPESFRMFADTIDIPRMPRNVLAELMGGGASAGGGGASAPSERFFMKRKKKVRVPSDVDIEIPANRFDFRKAGLENRVPLKIRDKKKE